MRVFVTGATGHIGSMVVRELLDAGHQVTGLARSEAAAQALKTAGADVQRGSLADLDILATAASTAEGVIHLAFNHDFGDHLAAVATDLRAVETIGLALRNSGKPFVNTSGTMMLARGSSSPLGTEDSAANPSGTRVASETAAIALAESGVRSSVIRLAPTVHGSTDHRGFVPHLVKNARETRRSTYVGDGSNRWPAVHTLDAAHLYRLALESAPAGTILHGVAEEGIAFRTIAQAIGDQLGVPVTSVTAEQAARELGFIGVIAALDNPTSSTRTRQLLGWQPKHPTLFGDFRAGHYGRPPS